MNPLSDLTRVFPNPEQDAKELVSFLRLAEQSKFPRNSKSWVHRQYYNGRGFYYYMPTDEYRIFQDEEILQGMVLNVAASVIDTAQSIIMSKTHRIEGVARTGDRIDLRSANVVTQALRDHNYRNMSMTRLRETIHAMCISGTEFICVDYDPDIPAYTTLDPEQLVYLEKVSGSMPANYTKLPDGRIRAEMPLGGTVERRVPGDLVFVENGPCAWSEVRKFAVVNYISVTTLKTMYPDADFDKLRPTGYQNSRGAGFYGNTLGNVGGTSQYMQSFSGTQITSRDQVVRVIELWERAGGAWDKMVYAGNRAEIELTPGGELGLRRVNPYVRYDCKPNDTPWAKSLFEDMFRPQYAVNKLASQQLKYFAKCVKDVIMLPIGSETSPITNDFNLIIKYDSNFNPPQFKPMDSSVLTVIDSLVQKFSNDVREMGQVNAIAAGDIRPRTNRQAISAAVEAVSSPLMVIRANMLESEQQRARAILDQIQSNYDWPRMTALMGDYGESEIEDFRASDIVTGTDVQVTDSDTSQRSEEERLDVAVELAKLGLFADDPVAKAQRQRIIEFAKSGEFKELTPVLERQNEDRALRENMAILKEQATLLPPEIVAQIEGNPAVNAPKVAFNVPGQIPEPFLDDSQLHDIHMREHLYAYNNPTTSPQARAMLKAHMSEHSQMQAAAEQAARAQEILLQQQQSLADAAGPMATTVVAANMRAAQDKADRIVKSPTYGGIQSGVARQ